MHQAHFKVMTRIVTSSISIKKLAKSKRAKATIKPCNLPDKSATNAAQAIKTNLKQLF